MSSPQASTCCGSNYGAQQLYLIPLKTRALVPTCLVISPSHLERLFNCSSAEQMLTTVKVEGLGVEGREVSEFPLILVVQGALRFNAALLRFLLILSPLAAVP